MAAVSLEIVRRCGFSGLAGGVASADHTGKDSTCESGAREPLRYLEISRLLQFLLASRLDERPFLLRFNRLAPSKTERSVLKPE